MSTTPPDGLSDAERKAWAEAERELLSLRKEREEYDAANTPAAIAARDAAAARTERDAALTTATAERDAAVALVPDLSGKTPTALTVSGALFGTQLSAEALAQGASALEEDLKRDLPAGGRILVSGDVNLVDSDTAHRDLTRELDEYASMADEMLAEFPPVVVPLAGAVVGAVLGQLVSLFSVSRTVTSTASAADATDTELAVVAALAAAGHTVEHHAFRLAPPSRTLEEVADLKAKVLELALAKALLEAEKNPADPASAAANIRRLSGLIEAITAFSTAITKIDGGRSLLGTVALHDALTVPEPFYSRLLLVLSADVEVTQVVSDRFFSDGARVAAAAVLRYALFDTRKCSVIRVGSVAGSVGRSLRLGSSVTDDGPLERSRSTIPSGEAGREEIDYTPFDDRSMER